jgi:hypothetical protein
MEDHIWKNVLASIVAVVGFAGILWLAVPTYQNHGMFAINNTTLAATSATTFKPIVIKPLEGVSLFAIVYLLAQLIERIVEPLSNISQIFGDTHQIEANKSVIDLKKENIKRTLEGGASDALNTEITALVKAIKSNSDKETKRMTHLWALSSILGIAFTYVLIGLFELTGLPIGRFWDALFSGVLLGAGTKSLHDLMDYVQTKGK